MATGRERLLAELTGTAAPANAVRCWVEPGVVKAYVSGYGQAPILTVTWRDVDVPASFIDTGYPLSDGDVVALLIQPPNVICLGRLVGPNTQ